MKPYFHELASIKIKNPLYRKWADYVLSLTRDDILLIVRSGLSHQARAIQSTVKEVTSGNGIPDSLLIKLDVLVNVSSKSAAKLRQSGRKRSIDRRDRV